MATHSQVDLLRKSVARLLANGASPTNPMVLGMQWQILAAERTEARRRGEPFYDQNPMSNGPGTSRK